MSSFQLLRERRFLPFFLTQFFGAFNDGRIRRLTLTGNRLDVASQGAVYQHPAAVLSMEVGPNGRLYFSDSSGIWRSVGN